MGVWLKKDAECWSNTRRLTASLLFSDRFKVQHPHRLVAHRHSVDAFVGKLSDHILRNEQRGEDRHKFFALIFREIAEELAALHKVGKLFDVFRRRRRFRFVDQNIFGPDNDHVELEALLGLGVSLQATDVKILDLAKA